MVDVSEDEFFAHYGTPRHSGRYPYGSGGEQNVASKRNKTFLDQVEHLKSQGLSETDIAKGMGLTTTQLRAQKSNAKNAIKQERISQAEKLRATGMSTSAIAREMGIPEPTARTLLAPGAREKVDILQTTAGFLAQQVDDLGFVDVGKSVELFVGVPRQTLDNAIQVLKEKGYAQHVVQIDASAGNKTYVKVLAPPGTTYKDIASNKDKIRHINGWSEDGGRTMLGIEAPPLSLDSKRVQVKFAEDGGDLADGVLYVRPGVSDLSMGKNAYAQVRVAVDGTHYMKGMAVYKADLPKGIDVIYNSAKSKHDPKALKDPNFPLKKMEDDPDNPFGSVVRQIFNKDENGVARKELGLASAMNIVNEEADWVKWSKNLPSQFLSKQNRDLAKQQLDMTYESRKNQLDEIKKLTNPAVRKKLLEDFASDVDAAAVHLKAAQLPRQATHVILPVNSLKDTEVYAPNFKNGEKVVLVRFPHGGTFEIPELTVNNRNREAMMLRDSKGQHPKAAIGINSEVAKRLSGADFDGDTVLVIPNNTGKIRSTSALAGLKNFDPQKAYAGYEGMQKMTPEQKQMKMGDISNLITDMTIKGASTSELARAVRHSMVVIDAEKHGLNYKQSAIDNGINDLKRKYQGAANAGSSTLISAARSPLYVPERKKWTLTSRTINEKGEKVHIETGDSYTNKDGKLVVKKTKSTKLAETTDANTLSSGTPIETVYAGHSNRMKDLANQARRESVDTKGVPYDTAARQAFLPEVTSLNAKLNNALRNAPLERQARILANTTVAAKKQANPDMDKAELKKLEGMALTAARARTGAKKELVEITQREWDAIQAGAITNNKLVGILNNTDIKRIKELAQPKTKVLMTGTKTRRAESMLSMGYTQAEVADALGVSLTTLKNSLT